LLLIVFILFHGSLVLELREVEMRMEEKEVDDESDK
jgi:hypothetical protein